MESLETWWKFLHRVEAQITNLVALKEHQPTQSPTLLEGVPELVLCPYDKHHRISLRNFKKHVRSCTLRRQGLNPKYVVSSLVVEKLKLWKLSKL